MSNSIAIKTVLAAIAEMKTLVGKYDRVGGVTPQESILELEQVLKDIKSPEYDDRFSDYSDLYKDVNSCRPRPYIPPTLKEMREFSAYAERMWKEEEKEIANRKAEAQEIEAARRARRSREIKSMKNAGSIGDLFPSF